MSFIPVMEYLINYATFGFVYWLLAGILNLFISAGVHRTGDTYNLLHYYWTGSIIVFIIFTGIYVVRKYNESKYRTGGF